MSVSAVGGYGSGNTRASARTTRSRSFMIEVADFEHKDENKF